MDQLNDPMITQTLIPLSVFTASLLGSLHCVSMCGGLVVAVAPNGISNVSYHVGRLIGYLTLGALAGLIGFSLFEHSQILAIASAVLIGSMLVYLGLQSWRGRGLHLPLPSFVLKFFSRIIGNKNLNKNIQAFLVGSFSAFLPCGWLYSFVLGALATQSPLRGAIFLSLFWLGTVPALVAAPELLRRVLAPIAQKAPKVAGVVLISAGLITVGLKIKPLLLNSSSPEAESCHPEH